MALENFGDAAGLVDLVRRGRAADIATNRTKTFGDVASDRAGQELQQMTAQEDQAAAQQQQMSTILSQIGFIVNTKTGRFRPVLPGEDAGQPGPGEVLVKMSPDGQPQIAARGRGVMEKDVARLSRQGMPAQLDAGYKVPQQYAGLADIFGLSVQGDQSQEEQPTQEPTEEEPPPPPRQARRAAEMHRQLADIAAQGPEAIDAFIKGMR